jgi:hypothetical protein
LEKLVESHDAELSKVARLHVNWAGEMTSGWDEAARKALRTTDFHHFMEDILYPYGYSYNLAHRGLIPEFILERLVRHKDIRSLVAHLPNTPGKILEPLSQDEDKFVRLLVTDNPSTPVQLKEKLLAQLSQDEDNWVRLFVAKNRNTPVQLKEKLLAHSATPLRLGWLCEHSQLNKLTMLSPGLVKPLQPSGCSYLP